MFSSQIKQKNPLAVSPLTSLDIQYSILGQLIKRNSQHLLQRQLELIQMSSNFIQKINEKIPLKDISTTQESLNTDVLNDDEDLFSRSSRSKLILRKSRSNCTLKRSNNGLSEAMKEVQRMCSQKTVQVLQDVVNDKRREKQKTVGFDRLQKQSKKLKEKHQAIEQQLIIVRKKHSDLQARNTTLQTEVTEWKVKYKDVTNQLQLQSMKGPPTQQQTSKPDLLSDDCENLRKYLEDRQLQIARKEKEVKIIQNKIQSSLEVPPDGCDRCCLMMRRIKDSVMRYRKFLEEQSTLAETLYNNYKALFS